MVTIDLDDTRSPAQRRRDAWARNLTETLQTNERLGRTPCTPKQLHQAVVDAGLVVSRQAVYLWLSGETSPALENQAIVARVCGVPHHMLFPVEAA